MITLILFFIAGILNACMDTLATHYSTSIFRFWKNQNWVNPSLSWHDKWSSKYKFIKFLMSTIFVWLTDFWHLCKFLMLIFISLGVVLYHPITTWYLDALILYCIFTLTFQIFYGNLLVKK